MKWSVTYSRTRLGPEMLTVLEIKGQVLHRVRLHVKVPGIRSVKLECANCSKRLPKFLLRLNEMSGGKETCVFSFGTHC